MAKIYFSVIFLSIFLFFLVPDNTQAQLANSLSQTNPSVLTLSPRYPEPNELVTVTLNDYSIDTSGATIQWFIDGVEVIEAQNERSLVFTSSELGKTTEILAATKLPNGSILRAKSSVTPVRLDILIEADTRVPSFYKGRAIPAVGGSIQVTALPFTGKKRNPESFSYKWTVGSDVQAGGSRFGKNSITFTAGFEKQILVSVDIIDTDGRLVTSESIYIPLAKPELYFYEVNPLRGISERAMETNALFIGEEIKVRAEPYFIDNTLFSKQPFQEWKLNGRVIANPSADKQEITLRRSGESGSFSLEYHIRNLKQLLQGVKNSISISF